MSCDDVFWDRDIGLSFDKSSKSSDSWEDDPTTAADIKNMVHI